MSSSLPFPEHDGLALPDSLATNSLRWGLSTPWKRGGFFSGSNSSLRRLTQKSAIPSPAGLRAFYRLAFKALLGVH